MDRRAPPPTPPRVLLQLPAALMPPRKRRSPRSSPRQRQATILAVRVPPSAPHRQIPAPPVDNDYFGLVVLADLAVAQADAEEAEAEAAARPAPAVEIENPRSSLSIGHGDAAATKASAEDYCKEAAFSSQGNASSSGGDQHDGGGVALPPADGASPMELDGDDMDLEPGEIPPPKPAAVRNADSPRGTILGKYKTIARDEPAATAGSSAHRAAPAAVLSTGAVVVGRDGSKAAATEMSAAQEKRKREVFVGGLSWDAMEGDVRAALSAAGEIVQVRMFMDWTTGQNKGYCFVAYRDAAMARRAVAEFGDVKICGKPCRVAFPEGNEKSNKTAPRDAIIEDYKRKHERGLLPTPTLGVPPYIRSWDHHAASYAVSSAGYMPSGYYIPMYHNGNGMYLPAAADRSHGLAGPPGRSQMGQSGSGRPPTGNPYRSRN